MYVIMGNQMDKVIEGLYVGGFLGKLEVCLVAQV